MASKFKYLAKLPQRRYRTTEEDVPEGDYVLPLSKARVAAAGSDITLVAWGQQVKVLLKAVRVKARPDPIKWSLHLQLETG